MKQIILKDKTLYITQDTYEIKRMKGRWVQSFFELLAIRCIFGCTILLTLMTLMSFRIESPYLSVLVGGIFWLIGFFLEYRKDISIPIEKMQKMHVNKNQLIINYIDKKRTANKVIYLPLKIEDRERAINELQKEGIIQNSIPEMPYDSERRLHRMNLYLGILGLFMTIFSSVKLFNSAVSQWVLICNSIILLFFILAIIFSLYKLLKIKNPLQVK